MELSSLHKKRKRQSKYTKEEIVTGGVLPQEVETIVKETSPSKKVEIEKVTVKEYVTTKEYDIVTEEKTLTFNPTEKKHIKPVKKDIIIVENKETKNKTLILNKEKE